MAEDPDLVVPCAFTIEGGEATARLILRHSDPPTAILAINDHMAIGVMAAARQLGFDVPGDLSVVGYNDIPLAARPPLPLTSVRVPFREVDPRLDEPHETHQSPAHPPARSSSQAWACQIRWPHSGATSVWSSLLPSWWHMQIEDLILEDDARGYFENLSDLDAFIVVGVDDGDMFCGCAVNPDIDPEREFGALGWCAQLVTRIEDLGFDQTMVTDGWQYRGDGRWQLWGRAVDQPPLE